MPKVACPRGSQCDNPPVTDSAGQKVREPPFGDPMVYCTGSRRTKNPRCSLKCTDAKRPYITTENAMMRALVFGAAALTLSAGAASAQAVYPSYGHAPYGYGYTATAPLYDYAGPASSAPVHTAPHGYGPLVYAPQLYAPTPAFPAPPAEPGYYTAQSVVIPQPFYDYAPLGALKTRC